MTLDDLIAQLEKAEGPSRALDAEIAKLLGWRVSTDDWWNVRKCGCSVPLGDEWCIRRDGRKDIACDEALPNFTSSIDAALTLVPDNENGPFAWNVAFSYNGGPYSASVLMADESIKPVEHLGVHQHSPAIALCIAALKARKEQP